MSMNIYIEAVREIQFTDGQGQPQREIQRLPFDALQTPTTVTYSILHAGGLREQVEAYLMYLKQVAENERKYDSECPPPARDADDLEDDAPYDYSWRLKQFVSWVDDVSRRGFNIEFSVM